ncbi:GNAT family N-acetyltransferase [Paenibacillus sp. MZ04-78.2]|uniref:GNAT family N-acetyltransferase n=1 Tax=Paenibacillus sp. MZ04-78.2 TaxID=2962034 RepID=UPI0020B6ED18|nr:GNAT family N-acetyltransferase [Paenibacillus sp. MZ04-78.2]MCP3776663.1 GNAT family N-acetyltransferase [Paenibacillus sp. MZ04-78.2]
METFTIQVVEPNNEHLIALIAKLDDYLYSLYPPDEVFGVDLEGAKVNEMVFVLACCNGVAAGCGAYRPLDAQAAELKRIFVDPSFRNKRIASSILSFLEQEAARAGFRSLLLETGPMQPESIALYKKFGFIDIDPFGDYVDCPSSICMEKKLP